MSEQVRVTIEIYGGATMTATGPADDLRAAVAARLRALGLAEGPSVVVQDAQLYGPRAVAALYRAGENHTTAEPVGRVTAVRLASPGGASAATPADRERSDVPEGVDDHGNGGAGQTEDGQSRPEG